MLARRLSLRTRLLVSVLACSLVLAGAGCDDDASGGGGASDAAVDAASDGGAGADAARDADSSPDVDSAPDSSGDTSRDSDNGADAAGSTLCDRVDLGPNADLHGERLFPENSYWNQPVTDAAVDPNSDAIIASIGADTGLHPDFGCCWNGPFGIPYTVVDGSTPDVPVSFDYADESDPGPYPIPADAPIEGGADATGDRHVLVIDCADELVYETFASHPQSDGSWQAGSGAVWDLQKEPIRAPYCTSADAAGLPILPGLVRYDEVATGEIRHALRFTVSHSRAAFLRPPASHWASSDTSADLPPMGMRVRLKSDAQLAADGVDVSSFSEQTRAIIRAMQTYGMIVADNGSDWYVSGAPSQMWDDDALVGELRQIKGRHFEVLQMDGLVDDYSVGPGECQLD